MKLTLSFAISLLLVSCGSNSPLVSQLEGSDSIAVIFKNTGTGAVDKVVGTSKTGAIKALIIYADGKETQQFKCGYDGAIQFYKQGSLAADIAFNYTVEGCWYFLHQVNGKITATEMNFEARDFLRSLATGIK